MNKLFKTIISSFLVLSVTAVSASASVLGSVQISGWSIELTDKTYLHQNVFMSDQASVKQQTEYYCEYTPNESIRPVVVNGESIYGTRTILQAMEYMKKNGMQPMIGINADFFSFKTGVPMGNTIINGELVTKDMTGQSAIGFRKDGTAFISWMELQTVLSTDTQDIFIDNINKYRQPGAVPAFLLTDKFGSNTRASTPGIDIILGQIDKPMAIGGVTTAVIEDISYNNGAVAIPEGKIVLTMGSDGYGPIYEQLQSLQVGQTVKISNEAVYDKELWNSAENGLGSVGGKIVENGQVVSGLGAGAAPRTAVGITPEGKIVFYVLDGRQTGYSYGAKLSTLAQRMIELGCTEAINLDGGGSTSIAGIYPGSDVASVLNSPSEGSLRSVANFIFLQNMNTPTGVLKRLQFYPYTGYYLSGMTAKFDIKAVDTGEYPMDAPSELTYSVGNLESSVTADGTFTLVGQEDVTVAAHYGDVMGQSIMKVFKTPTDIVIKNQANDAIVTNISGEQGAVFDLTAVAHAGYNLLQSKDDLFQWEIAEGNIGTIDQNGLLTLDTPGSTGKIRVSAGDCETYVSVQVNDINESRKFPWVDIIPSSENNTITVNASASFDKIFAGDAIIKIDGKDMAGDTSIQSTQISDYEFTLTKTMETGFFDNEHKVTVQVSDAAGRKRITTATVGNASDKQIFADTSSHWAKNMIDYMSDKAILNGIEENGKKYFKPDVDMTRAQFAVMMSNYLGVDLSKYEEKALVFADSRAIPDWAANQIKAMYEMGIINGKADGETLNFAPNDKITRAEVVTVLARTLPNGLYSADLEFKDTASIPAWAAEGYRIMYGSSFITGYEDGTVKPNQSITRAEAAKLLYNIM